MDIDTLIECVEQSITWHTVVTSITTYNDGSFEPVTEDITAIDPDKLLEELRRLKGCAEKHV